MISIYDVFEEEIWMPDDFTDCIWCRTSCGISWGDNIADLMNGDGDTYSCEVYGEVERGGYILFVLYNGCGDKAQSIFKLDKEVNEDAYWEARELEGAEDEED